MSIFIYDATEGPGLPSLALIELVLESNFHVKPENIIHEHLDRNIQALQRPKLSLLVCDENAGSVVVCTELDRLGQDAHDIFQTVNRMRSCRIKLFCLSLSGNVNLASGKGEGTLRAIAAYANLLTVVQGSRVRKGQAASKDRGVEPGRRVELSETLQRQCILLTSQGYKVGAVAKQLGINRWAVGRAIKRGE